METIFKFRNRIPGTFFNLKNNICTYLCARDFTFYSENKIHNLSLQIIVNACVCRYALIGIFTLIKKEVKRGKLFS